MLFSPEKLVAATVQGGMSLHASLSHMKQTAQSISGKQKAFIYN